MDNIPAFPTHIQIQTSIFCGSRCAICPHAKLTTHKSQGIMDNDLFRKIIDECSLYNPERIIPYLMADPLSDKNIFNKIDYIKKKVPHACIEISTTADKIKPAIIEKIFNSHISELRISSFGITKESYQRLMPGVNHDEAMRNIEIFIEEYNKKRRPFEVFIVTIGNLLSYKERRLVKKYWEDENIKLIEWDVISRAKNVDVSSLYNSWGNRIMEYISWNRLRRISIRDKFLRKKGCCTHRDTRWMHILFNGDVCLCCMDWRKEVIIGNVKRSSMNEIWNGKEYRKIRQIISGKLNTPTGFLCKRCECFLR